MEDNEDLMSNVGQVNGGASSTSIHKSAVITVDLAKFQNVKLYSSYSTSSDGLTKEEELDLNKKIWVDRGDDMKYGLKCCLRKMATELKVFWLSYPILAMKKGSLTVSAFPA